MEEFLIESKLHAIVDSICEEGLKEQFKMIFGMDWESKLITYLMKRMNNEGLEIKLNDDLKQLNYDEPMLEF